MNHSLYQDGILKALPFKRLPWDRQPVHLRSGLLVDVQMAACCTDGRDGVGGQSVTLLWISLHAA